MLEFVKGFRIIMKKLLILSIAFFAIFALFGCSYEASENKNNGGETSSVEDREVPTVSIGPDMLVFSSLEDFLISYVETKKGGIARGDFDFLGEWMPLRHTASDVLESVEFAHLETLYLPIGIPEDFMLHRIRVMGENVVIEYLHKDDMELEEAARNAVPPERMFIFRYSRWDMEDSFLVEAMLRQSFVSFGVNATENDLINGRYFFDGWHSFDWIQNRERFTLRVPTQIDIGAETTVNEHGMSVLSNPAEMVSLLEIRTVDLTDPEQIAALLRELAPPEFDCDYCEDVGCVECNPPAFDCEYCEDEGCEVCEPTQAIFYLAADAVTISNTNRHVSVFVGETATAVGEITLNLLDDIPELVVTVRDNLWTPTGPVEGIVIGVAGNASIAESRIVELEVTRQGVTVVISIELIAN